MSSKLIRDVELAAELNVSRSFLQKDRVSRQLIPFYKLGKLALYDPIEARTALDAYRRGGPVGRPFGTKKRCAG
jgi:hypothetical protein